jgi:hypothetical protein
MKITVKGTMRDEKGAVLIMVLVLLVVGGLILTPLLGLMSTGLLSGQVYENKMKEYYAADAGIEDALWKIQHGIDIPQAPDGYNLTVNDKYVWVTVDAPDTTQFLVDMLGLDKEKNWVARDWMVIGNIPEAGKAEITINWTGEGNGFLENVGIWMSGICSYVEGQPIPSDDIRATNSSYNLTQISYSNGTAFIWKWTDKGPQFDKDHRSSHLTFVFTPAFKPSFNVAFTYMVRQNVGLSSSGSVGFSTISATAISDTNTATAGIDSQTVVVANVIRLGCAGDEIEVVNWNIS